ncbi:hypothetical protein LTS15_002740 [Exophiala xenobiotica]|nr:hypothetical protein LTS15_002740 [Exophiala xenobiotica]
MAASKRLKVHHEEDGPALHYHFHGPIETLVTVTKSKGVTFSLPASSSKDQSIRVEDFPNPVDIPQQGRSQDEEDADDEETTEDLQCTTAAREASVHEETRRARNIIAEAMDHREKSSDVIAHPAPHQRNLT